MKNTSDIRKTKEILTGKKIINIATNNTYYVFHIVNPSYKDNCFAFKIGGWYNMNKERNLSFSYLFYNVMLNKMWHYRYVNTYVCWLYGDNYSCHIIDTWCTVKGDASGIYLKYNISMVWFKHWKNSLHFYHQYQIWNKYH